MVAAVTTNGTRPKPETWRDWMAPGEPEPTDLLTRDEMIERLRAAGVAVTPRTLVYWEGAGALPRPVRRWHAGAVRAVYPEWVVELAANIQAFRRDGVPLREIGHRLRVLRGDVTVLRRDVTLVAKAGMATGRGGNASLSITNRTDEDMEPALAALARRYTELSGRPVVHLEARFTDHAGHTHTHRFPPSQDRHDD